MSCWGSCGLVLLASWAVSVEAQDVPTRAAALTLRLGGIDAPVQELFADRPDVVAAGDGTLYVRVSSPPVIEVFAADGEHLRSIGREGEGPGEFRIASAHGLVGDTLWVLDFPTPRISRFGMDGSHVSTTLMQVIDHGRPFTAPQTLSALLLGGYAIAVPSAAPIEARERTAVPVYLGDPNFRVRRAVATVTMPHGMHIPGVGSFALTPFARSPLVVTARNGIGFVVARWQDTPDGAVVLVRYDSSGGEVWRRELGLPRARVSEAEVDSLVARGVAMAQGPVRRMRSRGDGPAGSLEELVRVGLDAPRYHPPINGAVLGGDGSVWLATRPGEWLVLDGSGRPSHVVQLPVDVNVTDATSDTAWGTVVGAYEVPYVVRYEVVR